jgi:hypothetical protein
MNANLFIYAVAAWLLPGLGHILLGRWGRGLFVAAACLAMTIIGWSLGGEYLFSAGADQGMMYWFHQAAVLGNGGACLAHWLFGIGDPTALQIQAAVKSATFEYGVRFLAVSGLLNYLTVLDVFDISTGAKK